MSKSQQLWFSLLTVAAVTRAGYRWPGWAEVDPGSFTLHQWVCVPLLKNLTFFPSVHSVKISSKPAGGFMRTCAADCLSMPLTSQMVGRTWTCSENESSPLLCHTGVPLAAPHLSVTLCLKYICAASVSHLGSSLAKMTQMSYCSLMFPVCPILL